MWKESQVISFIFRYINAVSEALADMAMTETLVRLQNITLEISLS